MKSARVTALRGVELGVPDLGQSRSFYTDVWGLDEVAGDDDAVYLRGTGPECYVLTLRPSPKAALLGVHLASSDREAVNQLHAKAATFGGTVLHDPRPLTQTPGGGYGFEMLSPGGFRLVVSSDVAPQPSGTRDRSRPTKVTHVVLNSPIMDKELAFFIDFLGFRLSDSTRTMEFLRCGTDHHSVALAHGDTCSLNHIAFEMESIDGLMRGYGRLLKHGYALEWGVGRHGPGNNVFAYFLDPNGFVIEYTTEVDQIDEATHVPATKEYWSNYPMRPCRWGVAREPSARLKTAMAGRLAAEDEGGSQ